MFWFHGQEISILLPSWKVIGNSEGESLNSTFLKESIKLDWNFQRVFVFFGGGGGEGPRMGFKSKSLLWGRYGYFLEEQISFQQRTHTHTHKKKKTLYLLC